MSHAYDDRGRIIRRVAVLSVAVTPHSVPFSEIKRLDYPIKDFIPHREYAVSCANRITGWKLKSFLIRYFHMSILEILLQ